MGVEEKSPPDPTCAWFYLHIHKDHETPPQPPHQQHGHMNSIDEQFIHEAEVHPPPPQQEQDDGEFVLEAQEDADAKVLKAKQDRESHPEDGGKEAAAEVQQEADESVHPSRLEIDVEVVVLGAHQVRGAHGAAGRVQAGGVGAVERAHPPGNGDHRHRAPPRAAGPRPRAAGHISDGSGTEPAAWHS